MKKRILILFLLANLLSPLTNFAQGACSQPEFRQFDFWIGEWDVFQKNNQKAGNSKISLILDSCIILEEWSSVAVQNQVYSGKSFNKYNPATKQWQQTWVDNGGGSIEFLKGKYADGKMMFETNPFPFSGDTMALRKLTFFNLDSDKVRQYGEISKDNGKSWTTEYDLEYRRRKTN